ncbi:MAG: hypothetical protein HY017_31880 [Betaproteobacteria bacterium]|nr:hypothetical protein [Betaproteobacteria bacterium]
MDNPQFSALEELTAMKAVAEALSKLDDSAVRRVLRWANDAFSPKSSSGGEAPKGEAVDPPTNGAPPATGREVRPQFETLADFYAAVDPQQDSDKALAVGYWIQVCEAEGDFDGFNVNKKLKDLGYGVSNITSAFNGLINRRPQLVIQTKKSGTSKQARKKYRLTTEGQRAVEQMLQQT